MCFVLYLGTQSEVPRIPWSENSPTLCTDHVGQRAQAVKDKFSLPCVTYVGSDQGCGCGFRHAMFQGGDWPEESIVEPTEGSQSNHEALVALIQQYFASHPFVELYGCWDGDFAEAVQHREEISLQRIVQPEFRFRERGYYRVATAR